MRDFMNSNWSRDILFLGSQSSSRRKLLDVAGIPYKLLTHASQECVVMPDDNFGDYVIAIACDKMRHLQLPKFGEVDKNHIFVLTADTLVKATKNNQIIGKPENLEHAKSIVKMISTQPLQISTGCCLKRFEKRSDSWEESASTSWATGAIVEFCVSCDDDLDLYFNKLPGVIHASGASIIDDFGQCFLKSINGSHSAVIGLPLFELRQSLRLIGFLF